LILGCGDYRISPQNNEKCDNISTCMNCSECLSNRYGAQCLPCLCINGKCNEGITGYGGCLFCFPNYIGEYCEILCTCQNGSCGSDGKCIACEPKNFGANCKSCTCQYGVCNEGILGDGTCNSCFANYIGANCDVFLYQLIGETILNTSLIVQNNSVSLIFGSFIISGTLRVENSILNITNSAIYIRDNFTLSNSSILLGSNQPINVDGCINMQKANITIDISKFNTLNSTKILLLNSTSGCLNAESLSIFYLNEPNCKVLKSEIDSDSLFIIFVDKSDCEEVEVKKSNIEEMIIYFIIGGSIVALVIIVLTVIFAVPSLKKKVFPFRVDRETIFDKK